MSAGAPVTIVEVGLRDGLQSLDLDVPTDRKLAMIGALLDAGVTELEVTSFAHPRVVPRLADAEAVLTGARELAGSGVTLRALVPNRRGAERAIAAGADTLLGLLSASETYTVRNQNMTGDEAFAALEAVAELAAPAEVGLGIAVSMAFASPYEDVVNPAAVLALVDRAAALGPRDLYLADTIGRATPRQVFDLCAAVRAAHPRLALGIHLHGSDARGIACAASAVAAGVTRVETAVLGLGGPVVRSPGVDPVGNLATDAVVDTFTGLGLDPGLDPGRVTAASDAVAAQLGIGRQAQPPALADVAAQIVTSA